MIQKVAGIVLEPQITKEVALHTLKNESKERYLENYTTGKNESRQKTTLSPGRLEVL